MKASFRIISPSCKKVDPYAQHNVGNLYNKLGKFEDAEKWYKKSAAQGLKESEMNLKKLSMGLKKKKDVKITKGV